jgi:hypothetical protein
MRFFYDWEFLEDGRTIEPISVGFVSEDGDQYYAVNGEMPIWRIGAHDWLAKNVVPHLPVETHVTDVITEYVMKGLEFTQANPLEIELNYRDPEVKPLFQIAYEIQDFILSKVGGRPSSGEIELWANYPAYDHVRLMQVWGPMIKRPDYLPMQTDDLQTLWKAKGRPQELPQQDPETEHHALYDALHDQELFNYLVTLPYSNWPLS